MKRYFVLVLTCCLLPILVRCGRNVDPGMGPLVISLADRWETARIENPVSNQVPTPPVIRFREDSNVRWSAIQGIDSLRIEGGQLVGHSISTVPLILLELPNPLGAGDELWSVEATVRCSGGGRMSFHPILDQGPSVEELAARIEELPISSPITPGGEFITYKIELDKVLLFGLKPATHEPQRILMRPTNASGVDFALESIRLTFRKEHFASIEDGPQWIGVGQVFRETLVSRSPETLVFDVDLPDNAWLDLAVGSLENRPPIFRVAVAAKPNDPVNVWEIQPDTSDSWSLDRVDLGRWAGQKVELRLSSEGKPGSLALWGAATVRASLLQTKREQPQVVIVLLADTLRRDHLKAWGHSRETAPTLSRLASEGVRFNDVVAQSTWTKPSVASILTSLYPSSSGIAGIADRLAPGETTLAEVYRAAGYATFATSSVPFTGQLTNLNQGVEVFSEFGAIPTGGTDFRSKTAKFWIDSFLPWLETHQDVPVFAFLHFMDPHWPFRPEAPFDDFWASKVEAEQYEEQTKAVSPFILNPLLRRFNAPSADELKRAGVDAEIFVQHEKNWYDGSIRAMDDQVLRLVDSLKAKGLGDKTILAFVSDHGEEFLDHGRHSHGTSVYGELTNVPMLLWGQGVPANRVVESTVETIDLYPTLVELSKLDPPERIQGLSLVPLFDEGAGASRIRPAFTELPSGLEPGSYWRYAVVDGSWKLIWNFEAPELVPEYELYDHRKDPLNHQDVAAMHSDVVDRLATLLRNWRSWTAELKLGESSRATELSAEQLEQIRSLGYLD